MALKATFDTVRSFDRSRIAYAKFGFSDAPADAPTVVLANGIACADSYWTYLVPDLVAGGVRVVYFDYRGHGRSGQPANPNEITVVSHARDLWAAADAAGVEDAVILGHSMGVSVALEAYRLAPRRVRSLLLAAGPFEHPLSRAYPAGLARLGLAALELVGEPVPWATRAVWRLGTDQPGVAEAVGRITRMIGERAPKPIMAEYFAHMKRLDPLLLLRMFRAMQLHTARDLLPDVSVPALVLAGSGDTMTPLETSREMALLLPDARLKVFDGARHTLPVDDPEEFSAAVIGWIGETWRQADDPLSGAGTAPPVPTAGGTTAAGESAEGPGSGEDAGGRAEVGQHA